MATSTQRWRPPSRERTGRSPSCIESCTRASCDKPLGGRTGSESGSEESSAESVAGVGCVTSWWSSCHHVAVKFRIRVLAVVFAAVVELLLPTAVYAGPVWLVYHGDNARTGHDTTEPALLPLHLAWNAALWTATCTRSRSLLPAA